MISYALQSTHLAIIFYPTLTTRHRHYPQTRWQRVRQLSLLSTPLHSHVVLWHRCSSGPTHFRCSNGQTHDRCGRRWCQKKSCPGIAEIVRGLRDMPCCNLEWELCCLIGLWRSLSRFIFMYSRILSMCLCLKVTKVNGWIYIALYYKPYISKVLRCGPYVTVGIAQFYCCDHENLNVYWMCDLWGIQLLCIAIVIVIIVGHC